MSGRRLPLQLIWAAIILVAGFLRFSGVGAGLPYIDYIDEGHVLHQAVSVLNHKSADTQWYGYPALPAYLTAGALDAFSAVYRARHGHSVHQDLPSDKAMHTPAGDVYDLRLF